MLDLFRTLPAVLKDIDGAEAVREAIVFAGWRRIAGEGLADHTVPIRLTNATLSIAVSNLMWQRQLKDLAGQMVFRLNAALGSPVVNFIEFVIDEAVVTSDRSRSQNEDELRRAAAVQISPELSAAAASIADEELRKQFLLAAGSCLARRNRMVD
jgi:hypothetical protein